MKENANPNPIRVIFVKNELVEPEYRSDEFNDIDKYFYVVVKVTEFRGEKFLEGETLYITDSKNVAYRFSERHEVPIVHMSDYLRANEPFDDINDNMPFVDKLRSYVEHNGGLIVEPRSRRAIRF